MSHRPLFQDEQSSINYDEALSSPLLRHDIESKLDKRDEDEEQKGEELRRPRNEEASRTVRIIEEESQVESEEGSEDDAINPQIKEVVHSNDLKPEEFFKSNVIAPKEIEMQRQSGNVHIEERKKAEEDLANNALKIVNILKSLKSYDYIANRNSN